MERRNLILGLSALTVSSLALIVVSFLIRSLSSAAVLWVLVWAGVESLLGFYSLSWGLKKSNKLFFSVFAGGSLLRLVSIGFVAGLMCWLRVSPTLPLLSLVFAYFFLSLVQLPFFNYGLR